MKAALALLAELEPDDLALLAEWLAPHLVSHMHEALLTADEASQMLGVHPKTLTRAAAAGRVAGAVRVGHGWRFRASELELRPPRGTNASGIPPGNPPGKASRPTLNAGAIAAADAIRGPTKGRT